LLQTTPNPVTTSAPPDRAALLDGGGGLFADLVVGVPGEDVGATADAGAANVFTNTGGGLPAVSTQTLLQNNPKPVTSSVRHSTSSWLPALSFP
jgi:hypothetical protein